VAYNAPAVLKELEMTKAAGKKEKLCFQRPLQIAAPRHAAHKDFAGGLASADSFAGGAQISFLHFAPACQVVGFKLHWIYSRAINSDPAHFWSGGATAD
jgi:hypothetical protein